MPKTKTEEEQAAINAMHPVESGRHDLHAEAVRLVSGRHGKGELVALVSWLLHKEEQTRAEAERLRELCRRAGDRLRSKARADNVAPDPEMGWWHPDGDLIDELEDV